MLCNPQAPRVTFIWEVQLSQSGNIKRVSILIVQLFINTLEITMKMSPDGLWSMTQYLLVSVLFRPSSPLLAPTPMQLFPLSGSPSLLFFNLHASFLIYSHFPVKFLFMWPTALLYPWLCLVAQSTLHSCST